MKNIFLTEKTKTRIAENTEVRIDKVTKATDEVYNLLKKMNKVSLFMAKKNVDFEPNNFIRLLEYRLFIGLLILDLASAMRIYLNAKFQYEGLFSARQIIIIINEGYKKIYNFIIQNDIGDKITRYRNRSFWVKNIGAIIEEDLPSLQKEYDLLTDKLESYLNVNFDDIKEQRDLSIHYHENPLKVYDMFLKLDVEETFKRLIPFWDILNKMFDFTHQIVLNYADKSDDEKRKQEIIFNKMILKLEELKNSENEINISKLQENIKKVRDVFIKMEKTIK